MVLTDQQLRQELTNFGEIVPPITQRNREQLRARLELLQSIKKPRNSTTSPTRTRGAASPSKARVAAASPSKTRVAASSPSKSRVAASSPSKSRVAASSPSKSRVAASSPSKTRAAASSPVRTRGSTTTTTGGGSGRSSRAKQTPNLIELSDSEAETASTGALKSRSIGLRSRGDSLNSSLPSNLTMTDDVEQSIARHRREIKQLLDSARDRNRVTSSTNSQSNLKTSPSTRSKTRADRTSSKSERDESPSKSSAKQTKKSSKLKNLGKPAQTFCKKYSKFLKNLFKFLFVTTVIGGGLIYYFEKGDTFFPRPNIEISCSAQNAAQCEDMKPVISALRKQLQVRTGEVDCGFRPKADILVSRAEVDRYLDEKGLKFKSGDQERWNALLTYIIQTPVQDIILWDANNEETKEISKVTKLSTTEAIRSLACRARQDISPKTLKNLCLFGLGSTGLLSLVWFLSKYLRNLEENEQTFKDYLQRAKDLIQESYEKYIESPAAHPSIIIDHIRDKLIPKKDQERLKHIWERIKNEISKQDSRLRAELQEIDGKRLDVWRWIKSAASSPKKTRSQTSNDNEATVEVGLTECLKLRNCFRSESSVDDEEIDEVIDSIQSRCSNIEHIGINSAFVYLKFSSKEAAAQGYHELNNWKYQKRTITVKYIRPNRYYEHFPEAQDV